MHIVVVVSRYLSCCSRSPATSAYTDRQHQRPFFFLWQRTNSLSASHSLTSSHFPSPPCPLEVGPLNTARGSGERCGLPQCMGSGATNDKRFGAYWSQKVQLWWQQFLLVFLNKCNFLHRNDLDIVRRVQFLAGRRPVRSFSRGAVATVALWKSAAPMARRGLGFTATARHRDPTTWNLAPAADC